MAISLEFIDFVVPVATIKAKYPGGWEACLADHAVLIGGRVWFDEHLFRDGAMSPVGIELLVKEWTAFGFEAFDDSSGSRAFKDFCVVESVFGGATVTCPWLVVDAGARAAHLAGTEPGVKVGRRQSVPRMSA